MRKIALITTVIGLGVLLIFLFSTPKEIESLDGIRAGTLVSIQGRVSEERELSFGKTFQINKVKIFCECKKSYDKKEVFVLGVVEDYYELRVKVLEIKIIDNE
ncbi:MAG: hypothetical protein ACP5NS_02270 [Candidatus Pacearchaeota archaeon]